MPLEFTGVPPIPRGMNLAGPPVFIDEAYCRWMQDVLVDRPGQIRMRGPMSYWINSSGISSNDQIINAAETYISDANGVPQWRGAVFVANDTTTTGGAPSSNAYMRVYSNTNGVSASVGTVSLPFVLTTKYDTGTKRWVYNTIIDAKPALGGGVWVGIIDDVTNSTSTGVSALFYWRGAGLPDWTSPADAAYNTSGNARNIITHGASVGNNVEPGMFAFDTNGYKYLGVVSNVSGTTVTLEKNVIAATYDESVNTRTIIYSSIRGFVHQYGRGFGSYDGGNYITSGRLGSDAEGFFKAANVTINGSATASDHKAYVYRNQDNQFVGKIKVDGIVSNTQVELDNNAGDRATRRGDYLEDEAYFVLRNDITMYLNVPDGASRKYPINLNYRRPDMRPGILTEGGTQYLSPAPGIFNSTYAGRQWFASFNTTNNTYDKYINRVVFSSTDNSENVNLSPDASDSIIIPGQENIRGIAGSNTGLLVFTETKTYIIRGTQRANFSLEELYPDGCISTPSIVQVGGGVIWAGKQGIYYYDGASVRNFTPEALGVYYTDGIKNFDSAKDRVYAFVYNNYLVINFTNWFSNYSLKRWQWEDNETIDAENYVVIKNNGNISTVTPDRITFCIYLPTGAIGTLSNFTPRGYMSGIMCMNNASNTTAPPTNSSGILVNLKSIFTENVDDTTRDGEPNGIIYSNDSVYSEAATDTRFTGPDFYLETKQYNWQEPTLKKWFRKLLFNLSINKGIMMIEFVDINNNSLVSPVTGSDPPRFSSYDESGFFLIPSTSYFWEEYEAQGEEGLLDWSAIEASGLDWATYFQGVQVRYSRWLGIRQNSLGFRMYGLHDYIPVGDATEQMPEIVNVNDWVWGLKPLRKGRN